MRSGKSPTEACKEAIERILKKEGGKPDFQVALIAVNKAGEYGGYSIYNNFNFVIATQKETLKVEAPSFYNYE